VRAVGVLLLLPGILAPQPSTAEIHGSVLGAGRDLLHIARIELRNGGLRRFAEAGAGAYDFRQLPPGIYDLTVSMDLYVPTIIRSVAIGPGQVRTLPPVALIFEGIAAACGRRMPAFLRPLDTFDPGKGGLGGRIIDDHGQPLADATVRLYIPNLNVAGAALTDSSGRFFMEGIPAGPHYEIEVARTGFFTEDFSDFEVQAGYEAFYDRIDLFPCEKGRCQAALRPIRPLPACG